MRQVAAISAGVANLTRVAYGTRCGSTQRGEVGGGGGGAGDSRVWRTGDLEFESFMRMLDSKVGNFSQRHNNEKINQLGLLQLQLYY